VTDDPSHTGFDWNDPFGAQTVLRAFCAAQGLVHVRGLSCDLYRIDLFRRAEPGERDDSRKEDTVVPLDSPLEDSVACHVVWNGAIRTRPEAAARDRAFTVPVLMYHRIADEGPEALAAWRIAPRAFEQQLRFLRRRGFHSLAPVEWMQGAGRGMIPGRPVMLTFDDAYLDFYRNAWPILARNGFSAHVFVPTGKVGGAADWDAAYGDPAPLMNWEQIAELAAKGCTFGSHMVSHAGADTLSTEALLHEAVLSRAMLEQVVQDEVRSIAPPFGVTDARTEQILEMAGYSRMFLDDGPAAPVLRHRLLTPRVEISGFDDIAAFARKLGMAGEPPESGDLL
jgi:peptidoglycan/xylan/chitin deacetylase (PgdA/CDA1 family)